ncbi:MAG: DNA-directed RNA polymerase subunit beta [Clostridia bacterium]|nr:DNA-directed RNA polymerase subunit beta [Clostridia bacterium]
MVKDQRLSNKVTRKSFSKINEVLELPNLIEIQKKSYEWFLREGMHEVLRDVSPIRDHSGKLTLDFVDFSIDETPKRPVEECKDRDVNFAAPLRVKVRLRNAESGEVTEKSIFMGDFPLMTDNGTFVINGAERVIVSQIVRSPGAYYAVQIDRSGKKLYSTTIIPYRGAWLEYETDMNDMFHVRIDKNRKMAVTVLLRALGIEKDEDIIELFGDDPKIMTTLAKDGVVAAALGNNNEPSISYGDAAVKIIYTKLRPGEPPTVESGRTLINNYFFDPRRYDLAPVGRYKYDKKFGIATRAEGRTLTRPAVSLMGEVVAEAGTYINHEIAEKLENAGVNEIFVKLNEEKEYRIFSNGAVYPSVFGLDLSDLGISGKVRFDELNKIMEEAGGDLDEAYKLASERVALLVPKHITKDDILCSVNYMIGLNYDIGTVDDIDHLGNRRLRSVGELLQNQMRIGFSRMDKLIVEKMNMYGTQDNEGLTPENVINIRPVVTAVREFFGSSPLSQFMDQNNPLAELTHKRRLSALGPGGLTRDRASFEVRDVHYTHYGRICPIETPEGPNIGLICYLSTYARINEYGFIEAPYRKLEHVEVNGELRARVSDRIDYMTADVEDHHIIAQANTPIDEDGFLKEKRVTGRDRAEIVEMDALTPDYMDVSPKMVVSVATAMIPFLENDDNSRALMGSNMQKQAVPLMVTENPIVATGMEYKAAVDSGVVVCVKNAGTVERVCADEIVIRNENDRKDVYRLIKFKRSNQGTCVNQRPIVNVGDRIEKGEVIADGAATSNGEISLGKNALIGFLTWEGYNYEDAVLLNERMVRDDVYTSIHIEEHTCEARGTKLGDEEITSEISNVGADAKKNLDANGIVCKGAEVHAGDILVGKITPKGDTELTPEERLLRAIFGEKSRETRDTSLRLPHGESGIVVDVKVFSRENDDELPTGVNKVVRVYVAQKRKISVGDKMAGRHGNKGVVSRILAPEDMPFLEDGTPLDIVLNPMGVPSRMNIGQVLEVHLGIAAKRLGWKVMTPVFDGAKEKDIMQCLIKAKMYRDLLESDDVYREFKNAADVPTTEYVYRVEKDPVTGCIVKDADGHMIVKFLTEEERADTELLKELEKNACLRTLTTKTLYKLITDEVTGETDVVELSDAEKRSPETIDMLRDTKQLKLVDGKSILYDGRTGLPFDHAATVGIMYYLKLHHLVDDKIHARSIGPYSLVTQQPLGGKAQFGGQRFGEMEVWALEAYGAAYTLQEILTVKSDDVFGRTKTFEAIVKGRNIPTPGIPESFKVLVKELQALALNIRVQDENGDEIELSSLAELENAKDANTPSYPTAEEIAKSVEASGMMDDEGVTDTSDLALNGYHIEEADEDGNFIPTEYEDDIDDEDDEDDDVYVIDDSDDE